MTREPTQTQPQGCKKSRAPVRLGLRPPNGSRSWGLDEMDCRGGVPGPAVQRSWWQRVLGR